MTDSQDQPLSGKVAAVTGGGSGIGRATALRLAQAGARVFVGDIDLAGAEETASRIVATPAEAIRLDVSQRASVETFFSSVLKTAGRLDIGVNNAGVPGGVAYLDELDEATFDRTISINLKGVWLCMAAEIRAMAGRGGAIVNTASVLGLVGSSQSVAYIAAKHAVVGMTKCAALEQATKGVRVNAVCPGGVDTPLLPAAGLSQQGVIDHLIAKHPVARLGRPEEIAEAILWLASPVSSFVTGATLAIDGGWSAQ